MTLRLRDLEKILENKWVAQWRYHNKQIEFGLPSNNNEIEWFPYWQAPARIVDLVCAYKKMLPKIEMRENEQSEPSHVIIKMPLSTVQG
jgi:hypothetical protein